MQCINKTLELVGTCYDGKTEHIQSECFISANLKLFVTLVPGADIINNVLYSFR